jgi:hypothetical protein
MDDSDDEVEEGGLLHQRGEEVVLVQGNGISNAHLSPGLTMVGAVVENGIGETRRNPGADQAEAMAHDHVGTDVLTKVSSPAAIPVAAQVVEHDASTKASNNHKFTGSGESGSQRRSRCAVGVVQAEHLLQRPQDFLVSTMLSTLT